MVVFWKRYNNMILASIFFFYLGCYVSLTFTSMECASAQSVRSNDKRISSTFDTVEYAVLILSSPGNELKRDAIRATWANFINNILVENGERIYKWNYTRSGKSINKDLIRCFFVLGIKGLDDQSLRKITSEYSHSNDILILEDFEDNYINLTSKLVLSLKWLSDNLKNLKYVVKCDDDSFVRIDLIIRDLEAFAPDMNDPSINQFVSFKKPLPSYKGLYWGYFDGRAKVYLNGKWQEKEWFLCDTYLPYALGGGYVISQSVVQFVARNSDLLSHYNSEDVSMGVWTAALDGINRVHDTRFDTEWKSRGCDSDMIVRHKQTPSDMFQMYRTLVLTQGTKLCKTDTLFRKSYKYNWNTLPSVCCKIKSK